MKHLFVEYHIAILAKENGFDEPCFGYWGGGEPGDNKMIFQLTLRIDETKGNWSNEYAAAKAPLYQQLVDWFREKHGIHIEIQAYNTHGEFIGLHYQFGLYKYYDKPIELGIYTGDYYEPFHSENKSTVYYDCLNKAFEEAFKLLKK